MIDAFHVGNSSLSEEGSSCALEETAAGLTFYTDRKMIIRRDAWIYIFKSIILPGSVYLGKEQIALISLAVILKQQ